MTTGVFRDVEFGVRELVRDFDLPEVGRTVLFAYSADASFPQVVLGRIGGGPQPGDAPLEDPRLSFSVYGRTKKEASDAAIALANALVGATCVLMEGDAYAYGFQVDSLLWAPEQTAPKVQTPRYVVDVTLTAGPR